MQKSLLHLSLGLGLLAVAGLNESVVGQTTRNPSQASPSAQANTELLPVGQPLDRDLKEGETHVFETKLALGEYLEVTVEQLGIDASVEITDGLGKPVMKIDTPTAAEERETVGFVAVRSGKYSVTIQPVIQPTSPKAGRYRLTVTARRVATAQDRSLDRGLRALSEALSEKDAAKVLLRSEAAYGILLPLLGAGHPNVRAAALAYARKAPKDKWLRAAQLAEPILAVREKDDTARPTDLLSWNGIILRGYANAPNNADIPCHLKEKLIPLFTKDIDLRTRAFGLGGAETTNAISSVAVFYRRCDPDKVPDFLEPAILERESALGVEHTSVVLLTRIYSLTLTTQTLERFSAFTNRRTEAVLANPDLDRRAKAAALMEAGLNRRNIFQGMLVNSSLGGKEPSPEEARIFGEVTQAQTREADRLLQQALALLEPEKAKTQAQYFECLTEIQRSDSNRLADLDNQIIAFAESISRLEVPELIPELEEIAHRLEDKLEPSYKPACSEPPPNLTETKEKIRHIYEEIIRLAESQFPVNASSDGADKPEGESDAKAPDTSGRTRPDAQAKKDLRKEIDGAALAYARFLFSTGETAAAAEALERGLAFHLKREADSISARIVFAAGFDLAGDEKRAAELYGQAQTLAENVADERTKDKRLCECLPAIAQFHERYGRYDEAESVYRRLGEVTNRISSKKNKDESDESDGDDAVLSIPEQGLTWIAGARGDEKAFADRLSILNRKFPDLMQEEPETPKPFLRLRKARQWRQNLLVFYAIQYAGFGNRAQTAALMARFDAGPGDDPEDAPMLWTAGLKLMRTGRGREALTYFERSVLAEISGEPAKAERHLQLAIRLAEELDSPENVLAFLERVAVRLENIPESNRQRVAVYSQIGRFQELTGHPDQALRTYQRLAEMGQGFTGVSIPVRERMVLELWRGGQIASAVQPQAAVNDLRELQLLRMVLERIFQKAEPAQDETTGLRGGCPPETVSESDLDFAGELNRTVSLHALGLPQSATARRAAFESVLRRKDRTPESFVESVPDHRIIETHPELTLMADTALSEFRSEPRKDELSRELFIELFGNVDLTDVRFSHWGDRTIRFDLQGLEPAVETGSGKETSFSEVVQSFVNQVIRKHPEYRVWLTPITLNAVQKALPADAALVEVVRYTPFDPKTGTTEGEERYGVYVLNPQGEPQWFDGGTAGEVDRAAAVLANEARYYGDDESKAATTVLENRFIAPALKLTGNAKRVYVAFDERVASLPLRKLVDGQGKLLGDSRGLIFIRSGRELLTMNVPR